MARQQAIEKRRTKQVKVRPWKVLADEWVESVRRNHGLSTQVEWSAADGSLARKLLKEVELDVALKMVRHFVDVWCPTKQKFPAFKLFWALKAQVIAEMSGQLATKRERLDQDEFDREDAKSFPKVGWGTEATKGADAPATPKREKLDRDEYNREESKKFPKIGWA